MKEEKIICGVCGDEIPSKIIQVTRGDHQTKYEEDKLVIDTFNGKGAILDISGTPELKTELSFLQTELETKITQNAFTKIFKTIPFVITSTMLQNIKSISGLIGNFDSVKREIENNKVIVRAVPTLGRHEAWSSSSGTMIPDVDVCNICKTKFQYHLGHVTIGYLSRNIPNLKLEEHNKDIWERIKPHVVEIELKDR